MSVRLVPHRLEFADRIYDLASQPPVKDALGLRDESVEDTKMFIRTVIDEEQRQQSLSRVILDETGDVIGVTTLMHFNPEKSRCHLGTWIGHEYWGRGYNLESKQAILRIAFFDLELQWVFLGARSSNIRSQKAQFKLPYLTAHVHDRFPEELLALERRETEPCVLHAVFRDDFLRATRVQQ